MDVEECPRCKGSGEIAIDAKTCRYVAPGPVPDDAKGVVSSTCFTCAGMGYVEMEVDLWQVGLGPKPTGVLIDTSNIFQEAASALEAKDAEIERLKEECAELRHGVEDQTEEAAYHKEQRAQAERALAEAVKVVESLLLSLGNNNSDRVKAARAFIKEHSKS